MSVQTHYRLFLWVPILLPVAIVAGTRAVGISVASAPLPFEVLAYSLIYGGIPYAALATWASWWIGGRTEAEIRRLMFKAPLLLIAVMIPAELILGLVVGALQPFAALAALSVAVILPLGYGYVGLALLARRITSSR